MDAADCEFRVVAVVAQVSKNNVVQFFVRHRLHQFRHLIVGQVPVPGVDALLDRPRAFRVRFQEFGVVVRFYEKRVRSS